MRKGLSIGLAALLAIGVLVAIALPHSGSKGSSAAPKHVVTVKGVIGADKEPLLSDPKVIRRLRELGIAVDFQKAGSRQIATSFDLSGQDFVWPSSDTAAQRILATHPGSPKTPIFYSPMVLGTFTQAAELLRKAGLARQDAAGNWLLDMHAYLNASEHDLRWSQIKGNTDFPVNKSVLITTADVRTSNSGAMYLAMLTYTANHDNVVDNSTAGDALRKVMPLFLKQGFIASTNDQSFNTYLVQGIGAAPMVLIYESQFVEKVADHDGAMTPDMVLMYPYPTIFTDHSIISFTDAGKQLARALTTDRRLRELEIRHGFRTPDAAAYSAFAKKEHVKVPDRIVNVIDAPAYETLEAMIKRIEAAYDTSAPQQ